MRKLSRWIKIPLYGLMTLVALLLALFIYLASVALVSPPQPESLAILQAEPVKLDSNCYVIGNNWIRKSNTGLWEMYIEGDAFERGVINGKLSKHLVNLQEEAFAEQINKMVPSKFYRHFLKYFIGWFNRDLDENVPREYRLEIYGVSRVASHEYDYIGDAYQRMLNYHAAHDIGHALQNLALVGCTSFATWNDRSEDSALIVGRNFDFYVGDKFAENKLLLFCNPQKGYKFMMVTWGGMTGVVSGMNMEGVTVTINAAKSALPSGSATPISLLAREILQYAGNIDEAIKIAGTRKTFVSESFLVSSAKDNRAVIIEKTPDTLGVYSGNANEIICTNHYQSNALQHSLPNKQHMDESASVYRYKRMQELLGRIKKNTPQQTAALLRDQGGLNDKHIGMGNEKAVNQLIAHHSIIFEPEKKIVWVSSNPWQLGEYAAYDLNAIFGMKGLKNNHEIADSALYIAADPFLETSSYQNFVEFRKIKAQLMDGRDADVQKLIELNPEYYHSYALAGDYMFSKGHYAAASAYYLSALRKEIATKTEENHIKDRLSECKTRVKNK